MSPINGVDDHATFFPIQQDANSISRIGENDIDSSAPSPAGGDSDFHNILQALIQRLSNGTNPQDHSISSEVAGSTPLTSGGNNANTLLSLLDQIKQSSTPGEVSGSIDSEQAIKSLMNLNVAEHQNSTTPISSMSYTGMITRYKQAMQDFREAFDLLPAETYETKNVRTTSQILNSNSGAPNVSNTYIQGVNPTKAQVINYITEQCKQFGIPVQLGLATATTESDMTQFNKDGTPFHASNPDSTDWGIMQVNDKAWSDTYDFNRIKSDWQYNVRAGLQILKANYDAAIKNSEGSKGANNTLDNLARAAYSGYNAGTENLWRYRTPVDNTAKTHLYDVINNDGYDLRDIRFWNNYQKL